MTNKTQVALTKWSWHSAVPIYFFIFLSGSAGLIYQVAWHKYLSRILGSDSIATAIILAAFLGGLSAGYYLCGKFTTKTKNNFRAYAILEGIIGSWGLAFPLIFRLVDELSQSWSYAPPLAMIGQGLFCSLLLMGIPTMAMGGTIPILTRGISRSLAEATHVHARIYAINTGGACLGTLLAGFYLIPQYGLSASITIAAILNLSAGGFFLALARQTQALAPEQNSPIIPDHPDLKHLPAAVLYAIAFLSGFYVMTLENVLIRLTGFAIGSSAYSFSLIVAVFILCIALGSIAFDRQERLRDKALFFNQLTITVSLVLVYLTLDSWPYWAHVIRVSLQPQFPGMTSYYVAIFITLLLIFIIPVGCMGATVPILFHEIKRDLRQVGRHSGFLFSLNTVGNLVGSLAGGIIFYYFFDNAAVFSTAIMLAALSTGLASWNLPKRFAWASLCLWALALILIITTPFYNQNNFIYGTFRERVPLEYSFSLPKTFFKLFNTDKELLFYEDGPVSTVSVIESPFDQRFMQKPRSLVVNGKNDSSTLADLFTLKLLTHIPALLAESRQRVLIIGLGTGVTAGEMTLYPDVQGIDVAEISPTVIKALPNFDSFNHELRNNPRVSILAGDAFRILARSHKKWDIIISEPSNPWVSGVDSLFTREFYRRAKKQLNSKGLFAQWAHTYDASPAILAMIANTMQQEFAYVRTFITTNDDLLFLASNHDFSGTDLKSAEALLQGNNKVRESLGSIYLGSLDAILLREIWSPTYIKDFLSDSPLQSLNHPRLHYLAGKDFFMGSDVPEDFIYSPRSAAYKDEYLLARKYPSWGNFPFSQETYNYLMLSARDTDYTPPPIFISLSIKAILSYPRGHRYTDQEKITYGTDLLYLIIGPSAAEVEWQRAGLGGLSFRDKTEILLEHIQHYRNWIAYYPTDGLYTLLRDGIEHGKDIKEKNWCALQLALILLQEQGDINTSKMLMSKLIKGNDGKIILAEEDAGLLLMVNTNLAKRL
jgi:spermidine synthase